MKIELVETINPNNFYLNLTPETPDENMKLIRFALNAKPNIARVSAYLTGDSARGSINFQGYNDRKTSIHNTDRKKK